MLGNDGTECRRTFWWQQRRHFFSRYIYMIYFNLNVTYMNIHFEHNVGAATGSAFEFNPVSSR